jgi:hypothetical protein
MTMLWIFGGLVIAVLIVLWWRTGWDPLLQRAKKGEVDAQFELAMEFYDGVNRKKDRVQAAYWFEQAAENKHMEAQAKLAHMYETAAGGLERDREKAVYWRKKAAEQGHGESQARLGVAYFHGRGIPKSYFEAYCWLNVAVAANSAGEDEREIMKSIEQELDSVQILRAQKESVQRHERTRG